MEGFNKYILNFQKHLIAQNLSENTIRAYRFGLRCFSDLLESGCLEPERYQEKLDSMAGRYKPSSLHCEFLSIVV